MNSKPKGAGARACWFVGATYGSDDQTPRFLQEGIWEDGYEDKYLDAVEVHPGWGPRCNQIILYATTRSAL